MLYGSEEFDDRLIEIIKNEYRHPLYKESVEHAEEMSWHFYGTSPDSLLKRTRPNEDKAITEYRLANYEPHTKSAADKCVNITSKIFNPNLYSIRWAKDKENENARKLHDYSLEYFPDYNSVVNYTKDVLLRKMLADPNAVVAVKPSDMPESQTETVEPTISIYGSDHVYDYDEDFYLIFLRKEKIGKTTYHVFEYYDKTQFIEFYATVSGSGESQKLIILDEPFKYYPFTAMEYVPVWKLRGMSEAKDDGSIIFKSYFYSAVPFWNDAITHESDLKAAFIRHLFPQKYELSEQCNFKYPYDGLTFPCKGGKITFGKRDEKAQIIDCPHCSGTGWEPIGPYGVYRYVKEKLTESGPLGVDPVGYITVPVDATKMLDERVDKLLKKGLWAINMDVEDEVGAVQSGTAKAIDRSAQYDMLYTIGSVVFEHIENFFYFFNKIMFAVESQSLSKSDDENLPEVNKPTQFDILSTAELLNNYKISKESGVSSPVLVTKEQEILSKDLTTNPDLKKFAILLLDLDPMPGMDDITIRSNVMMGFNSKSDGVIHFNLRNFVERAIRENKGYEELPKDKKLAILDIYAKEFIAKNKPTLDPNLNGPTT